MSSEESDGQVIEQRTSVEKKEEKKRAEQHREQRTEREEIIRWEKKTAESQRDLRTNRGEIISGEKEKKTATKGVQYIIEYTCIYTVLSSSVSEFTENNSKKKENRE